MNLSLIVQLVLGALGGNIGGSLFKNLSLGTVGNSIAGIVGGGIGGQILQAVLGAPNLDASGGVLGMGSDVIGGGIGGVIVMAIVGLIRNVMMGNPHPQTR